MTIEAKIIADSYNASIDHKNPRIRLTTWELWYPRYIHAELMTHRAISRNASSSRAIPVEKQLARIEADMAMPVEWGKNRAGMQATELITPEQEAEAKIIWGNARDYAVHFSRQMLKLNIHKQIVNRIAEPFSHIRVIASGTEWANFFSLRHHQDAQPEFRRLAEVMAPLYQQSIPQALYAGEWHLPYVGFDEDVLGLDLQTKLKCSVARCARVSYNNHDGSEPSVQKDLELYDRLVGSVPLHASPTEHQATPFFPPDNLDSSYFAEFVKSVHLYEPSSQWGYPFDTKWKDPIPWSANYRGFFQYRQSLRGQNQTTFPFPME